MRGGFEELGKRFGERFTESARGYLPAEKNADLRNPKKRRDDEEQNAELTEDEDVELAEDLDVKLLDEELNHIKKWLEKTDERREVKEEKRKRLTGLALSGGGIRSATFSLGVMQALANADLLCRVDYLSTVSGGGYIGTGFTWWQNKRLSGTRGQYGSARDAFPYGLANPKQPDPGLGEKAAILAHLRANGNYLTPGGGIGFHSGLAIVLRALLLNLIVWIPLIALIFWLMLIAGPVVAQWISIPQWYTLATQLDLKDLENRHQLFQVLIILGGALLAFFVHAILVYGYSTHRLFRHKREGVPPAHEKRECDNPEPIKDDFIEKNSVKRWILSVVALALAGAVYLVAYILGVKILDIQSSGIRWPLFSLLVVVVVFLQMVFAKLLTQCWAVAGLSKRYAGRRFFEVFAGKMVIGATGLIILGTMPLLVGWTDVKADATSSGVIAIILGMASALWGHLQSIKVKAGSLGDKIVLPLGSAMFLYGVLVLSYVLAVAFVKGSDPLPIWILATAVIVAVSSGYMTNINLNSFHRFYRDRLMEAFMPDIERVKKKSAGTAKCADDLMLQNAWNASEPTGPFPIINTNLILADSETRKYRLRGGDNFILTPFKCGSNATGWENTSSFAGGTVTLATAMAISGAAANPNAGAGGKGATRGRLVSLVMKFLNVRLGYWVRAPGGEEIRQRQPHHFHPGASFALPMLTGRGHRETENFLEISDGGHFENLGVYELVRRGCKTIIVCDGGQDRQASYQDFVTAVRRIERDFGAEIIFDDDQGPDDMITSKPKEPTYPKDAEYADRGYFVARICYHRNQTRKSPEEGRLIYLKTTMVRGLSVKTRGYKGANPDFPDQTTADQFFDEEQFEAYRDAGYHIASEMIKDTNLAEYLAR